MPPWLHKPKRNFARSLPWRRCSFSGLRKRPRLATLWEGFMPEETKAHIAEQAEALVKTISDGRLDRPLLSAVASFLHYPAMASLSRLAYLLKAFEAALKCRRCAVALL